MGRFEFAAPGVPGATESEFDFTVDAVEAFACLVHSAGVAEPNLTWAQFVGLRRMGVGKVAERLLVENHLNEFVLIVLKFIFPGGDTSMKCVTWYRNKARKDGLPVKTQKELKREAKQRGAK